MIGSITRVYGELGEKRKDHQKRIMDRTGRVIDKILAEFSANVYITST